MVTLTPTARAAASAVAAYAASYTETVNGAGPRTVGAALPAVLPALATGALATADDFLTYAVNGAAPSVTPTAAAELAVAVGAAVTAVLSALAARYPNAAAVLGENVLAALNGATAEF